MSRPSLGPGRAVLDVALALALTLGALAGWATTYDGSRWFVVGAAGAGIGAGLAAFFASRGFGLDVLLLVLLPVYLLSAGPVASSARIGDRMFEDVISGTVNSWAVLVGTHPPVDGRGILLLPPYLVGLLCGGLAAGIALRSRSPGAPLGPPLVAFAGVLVLGRHEPVWPLGHALLFGAACVAWVLVRGLRLDVPSPGRVLLPRLLSAGLVLALAAALAPGLAERAGSGGTSRLVLREVVPTYAVSEVETPLSEFRRFTDQPPEVLGNVHDSPLFTVTGLPPGTRLRFAALDTYDQVHWVAGDQTVPGRFDDRFLRVGRTVDNPAEGKAAFANVTVHKSWDSQWVATAGALQWFGFDGRKSSERVKGFRFNPATGTGVMTSDLTASDDYEFATVLVDDRLTRAMEPYAEQDPALFATAKFVDIPAHAWSEGARSPMDAVFRAAATLRTTGRYSDGASGYETKYLPGHDRARIGPGFIHGSLTGNDEQYAAVMALVAVRLGVPARVVVGAVVPRGGVVRGSNVEAWVEVRVADGSWRTLPTELFMGNRPPGESRFDQNPDPDIKLPQQPQQPQPQAEPQPPKAEQPPAAAEAESREPLWWPWALLALVLGLAAGPLAKLVRRRRRLAHPRVTRRYSGAWLELVDTARDLGIDVSRGTTRQAQAAAIGCGDELAWAADRAIFGIDDPDPAGAAAYWRAVDAERRALLAGVTRRQRVVAALNPASLRRNAQRPVGSGIGSTEPQMPNGSSPSSVSAAASRGRGTS